MTATLERPLTAQEAAMTRTSLEDRIRAHVGPWVPDDLEDLPGEGLKFEIVRGELLVSAASGTDEHSNAIFCLQLCLTTAVAVKDAPYLVADQFDVVMGDTMRAPDIVVFDAGAKKDEALKRIDVEAVLLVVEVLSPSTQHIDWGAKRDQYAAAGVPAYWLLETRPVPRLTTMRLVAGAYVPDHVLTEEDEVEVLDAFRVRLDPSSMRNSVEFMKRFRAM